MEIIPCTYGNHSMDPWKSLEDNGNKGYGNYNLHWGDYFLRCMEFSRPFHTVEISSRYLETLPWQTMIPWAFFLQCRALTQHDFCLGCAGADSKFQWIGMMEYIFCYGAPAIHGSILPASRLVSRKILIEQNIKIRTGPALWYAFNLLGLYIQRA